MVPACCRFFGRSKVRIRTHRNPARGLRTANEAETAVNDSRKALLDVAQTLATRLLRIVPEAKEIDWRIEQAALWRGDGPVKGFVAHPERDDIGLDDLLQIDRQKALLEGNTRQFLAGYPANNVLLWGARGTGKSSLVHGLLNRYAGDGLRLVEVNKTHLAMLPDIVRTLRKQPYRYLLFCDDLSFGANDHSYKTLKSALEGSIFRSSGNTLVYATSNRRHLLPEYASENTGAEFVDAELHPSEAVEEKISLSDRFGLCLSFYPFRQSEYLVVARHWVETLAQRHALACAWNDELEKESLGWALGRGVRSGRTAEHFARHWIGRTMLQHADSRKP